MNWVGGARNKVQKTLLRRDVQQRLRRQSILRSRISEEVEKRRLGSRAASNDTLGGNESENENETPDVTIPDADTTDEQDFEEKRQKWLQSDIWSRLIPQVGGQFGQTMGLDTPELDAEMAIDVPEQLDAQSENEGGNENDIGTEDVVHVNHKPTAHMTCHTNDDSYRDDQWDLFVRNDAERTQEPAPQTETTQPNSNESDRWASFLFS